MNIHGYQLIILINIFIVNVKRAKIKNFKFDRRPETD